MGEKKTNNLSIYLIKSAYTKLDAIVKAEECRPARQVPVNDSLVGTLFIKKTPERPPSWAKLFSDHLDINDLSVPGISAVFVLKVGRRIFALTFGQAGRFLLRDDVWEERFGLLCALNSVDPKTFRCVDMQSMDAIQSQKRVQAGQETTPDQFGLDVEQDMLKAIVGAPRDSKIGNRMTGNDALSVSVKMDLSDLPQLLEEYRRQFETDLSTSDHEWVHNISLVKSSSLIGELENVLDKKLALRDFQGVWLAIPEIIDWTLVRGFMYSSGRRGEIHPDITMRGFLKTLAPDSIPSLELMRRRRVSCADGDHKKIFKSWTIAKCLYAEVDYRSEKYILNDGKWFCVASDFVQRTNYAYKNIAISSLNLPAYRGGGEGKYNASVAGSDPGKFALLDDKNKVMHGGGHGQVEICDLFSIDRQLVHVKIYGKSSVFSHLFAQGFVSGQLIQIDSDFRRKVVDRLPKAFEKLVAVDRRPEQDEFTVVFAVISEEAGDGLHIPFFSRVNLNNTARVLKGLGFKVELLKIPFEPEYAITTTLPPSGKRASNSRRRK